MDGCMDGGIEKAPTMWKRISKHQTQIWQSIYVIRPPGYRAKSVIGPIFDWYEMVIGPMIYSYFQSIFDF